ncbi:MAG: CoxG family protein [Lautropia sp.]
MKLQGERIIPASVEKTWTALNDPETLKACITGCETIETTGENQFLATMAVRIGPVNAKFKGRLQLTDIVPLASYRILFDGQGGVAGFGKGSADVQLSEQDGGGATRLAYAADAQIGGKLAQIGSRLVESAAAKIADEFFAKFEQQMTAGTAAAGDAAGPDALPMPAAAASGPAAAGAPVTDGPPAAATPASATPAAATPTTAPATTATPTTAAPTTAALAAPDGGSRWWLWIAGAVVIALLLYFVGR